MGRSSERERSRPRRRSRSRSRSRSPPPRRALDEPVHEADLAAQQAFVWHKKRKRDKRLGLADPSAERERFDEEIELLKRRRAEREEERRLREEERVQAQRDADRAQFGDWEAREDAFQLQQARTRAQIRVREGRPTPVDLLALALQLSRSPELLERGFDVDPRPPARIIESIEDPAELRATALDIEMYMWLEDDPGNQRFWECLLRVCAHARLQLDRELGHAAAARPRVTAAVERDVRAMFHGKPLAKLQQLEQGIVRKLQSGESIDVEYWECMRDEVQVAQARAELDEFHHKLLILRDKMVAERRIQRREHQYQSHPEGSAASSSGTAHPSTFESGPGSSSTSTSAAANTKSILTPEQVEAQEVPLDAEDEALAARELPSDAARTYSWALKYRPRKPKYVNRVNTGYEWNKYNQTHYDGDNPPPKVVQGYKFNIFYPDLLDKSRAPTYRIEPSPSGSKDTVILRFIAGPPYEDIAFEIVNREWEMSHRRGFKCVFERGVLQLHFQFRRFFYRK